MNKKGARRLLALLLSLVMLVGAVPVAFAAEPESGGVTWEQVDNLSLIHISHPAPPGRPRPARRSRG